MYRVYNHSQNTTERLPLSHTHHTHTHTPQKHLFDVPTALLYDTQHTNARPKHTRTTHFFTLLIFTHTTDVFTYVKNEKKQHTQHTARTFTHARQTPHLFTHTIGRGGIRTPDLLVRSQILYPTKLHVLVHIVAKDCRDV